MRRPAIETLRLQLKPAHRSCGFVQGAWWPRSTELTSELPSLLAALSLRVGSIDSVLYHEGDWSPAPLSIKHRGDQVILGAHQEWPNVVSLFGPRFGRLELLVVPPHAVTAHAYNAVTTATCVGDASTPDQLLGISTRRAGDPLLSPVALQRWESDGGAVLPSTITGSDAGRSSTRLRGVLRGRRTRYVGTARGPVTAQLLAEQSTIGKQPDARREFRPLHRTGRQSFRCLAVYTAREPPCHRRAPPPPPPPPFPPPTTHCS